MKGQTRVGNLVAYVLLSVAAFLAAFPFLWMFITSLKSPAEVFAYPPVFQPAVLQWKNYATALTLLPFHRFFGNTLQVAGAVVLGEILSASLVAWGFARFRFPGRDILFNILLATMMIPFVVRLVPLFILYRKLGWINSYLPLTIPSFFGTAFNIFLMRQFFMTLPKELMEAARMDGCSEPGIWYRIALPLARAPLGVVALLSFQNVWNDFLAPLIFLHDTQKYTIGLGLLGLIAVGNQTELWHLLMAASTTMVLPLVVLFFFTQRSFVKGVTVSGLKG